MIETNAFFVMFLVQILAMSVLHPAWVIKFVRAKATEFPAERFKQLYPGVDANAAMERYLTGYRALNTFIALLGLLLWCWLFNQMRRPNWDDGPGEVLRLAYSMLQVSPLIMVCWCAVRYDKLVKKLLEGKRTAVLQRRGLFDFVSPFTIAAVVLIYFVYVAYMFYIAQNPFPGFAGPLINIVGLTLNYALVAFAVYKILYGRKNPLETHAARMHAIGLGVRACFYICIFITVSLLIDFTLKLLDQPAWQPFAGSVHYSIFALLLSMMFTAPPRRQEVDRLGESPVT